MKPIAEPLPISAGMAKRCWQSLPCSALGAGASQKQTGKVLRQGEGKHLTPYLININRHINNRISTCAVICNPPVNMLTRPSWKCPAEARRQGRVWECTVSSGAADGLGAGCCGHRAVEGSAGTPRASRLHRWHVFLGCCTWVATHEDKVISSAGMGLQQPPHLLWAPRVFTPVQALYRGLELPLWWLPVAGNAADLRCVCYGLEEKVVSNKYKSKVWPTAE